MKIIFMGTPDFSVGTLEALVEAGHEVVLAVTQPDKPKGRGKENGRYIWSDSQEIHVYGDAMVLFNKEFDDNDGYS